MAIVLGKSTPAPPEDGLALIRSHVSTLLATGGVGGVASGVPVAYDVARPHPVYSAPVGEILAHNQLLNIAELTGWQYLILDGESVAASGELAKRDVDGVWLFSVLRGRTYAAGVIDALMVAEELPEVATGDYELRILRVPELYFRAVWLLGSNGHVLIPIERAPRGLTANVVTDEATVKQKLIELTLRQ